MEKKKLAILIITTILIGSCNPVKKSFVKSGNSQDDAIQIAILDFSNTDKLLKRDSVFSIEIVGLPNNKDVMVVNIGKNNRKLLLTSDAKIGSIGKLPSRYFEKEGRLFFWWDDGYPLTEETLATFNKYHLLQDDKNGTIKIPDFIITDAQKDAHYYFCKSDISGYKKVVTKKGIGYYDPPSLKCSKKN